MHHSMAGKMLSKARESVPPGPGGSSASTIAFGTTLEAEEQQPIGSDTGPPERFLLGSGCSSAGSGRSSAGSGSLLGAQPISPRQDAEVQNWPDWNLFPANARRTRKNQKLPQRETSETWLRSFGRTRISDPAERSRPLLGPHR